MREGVIIQGMSTLGKAIKDLEDAHTTLVKGTDHEIRELAMSLKRVAMVMAAQQAVLHGGLLTRLRWVATGAFPKLQLEDVHRASAPWLTGSAAGRFRPVETLPVPEPGTAVAQAEAVARQSTV